MTTLHTLITGGVGFIGSNLPQALVGKGHQVSIHTLKSLSTGILSIFSTRLRNGRGLSVFQDGLQSRDFVYVDGVVEATMLAWEHPAAAGLPISVGSRVRNDFATEVRTIKELLSAVSEIEIPGNLRIGDIHNYADMTLSRDVLGFSPRVDFANGIAQLIAWVLGQELAAVGFARSIEELKAKGLYR